MKNYLIIALASCSLTLALSQFAFAQDKPISTPVSVAAEKTTERELDGLYGPVRRVRVETAKITVKDGNFIEGPRVLRETATYDPKGRKIDSVAHPVESSTLPGKEEYRYDNNGNIVEMILRGDDGSTLSKETYRYELDEMGNWKKMTSSVAIYESGKIVYEPIEITYRTIAYYYGQAVDKLVSSGIKPATPPAKIPPAAAVTTPPTIPLEEAPVASRVSTTSSNVANVANSNEPTAANIESRPPDNRAPEALNESPASNLKEVEGSTKTADEVLSATKTVAKPAPTEKPAEASLEKVSVSRANEKETANLPEPETTTIAARLETKPEVHTATTENPKNEPIERPAPPPSTPPTAPAVVERNSGLNPVVSHYEKGLAHLAATRYAEAVKEFSEGIKFNPNDAQAYLKLGVAHSAQGQYKEAVAVLKMAIQIKREIVDAQGYYHLGHAYAALGKHSNALESFKQALYIARAEAVDQAQAKDRNSPPLALVHHGMGAMYYNLGRPKDAIKELKRAIELNPKLADAYYVLALSYIETGNRRSAEAQQKTLQTLDSDLARKIDTRLFNPNSGVHCRTVFGPCN